MKSKALIEQYNGFAPRELPDEHVNGALTVGENIGDLGGLTIGHRAYLISKGGTAARDQVRRVADRQPAQVADVLADGELAVDVLARQGARLEGVVLRDEGL